MAAHTPGPWRTDADVGHEAVLGSDGAMVADCAIFLSPKFGKRTAAINRANARLSAAAPDMLAALMEAQAVLAVLIDPGSQHVSSQHVFAQATAAEAKARAAIAKAEGRS